MAPERRGAGGARGFFLRKRAIVVFSVAVAGLYFAWGGSFVTHSPGGTSGGALRALTLLHRRWTEGSVTRHLEKQEAAGNKSPGAEPGSDTTSDGVPSAVVDDDQEPDPVPDDVDDADDDEGNDPALVTTSPAATPAASAAAAPAAPPAVQATPPATAGVFVPPGPQAAPAAMPIASPPYPSAKPNPKDVIMTLVSANNAARHAVALVQTLRDVGTQADAIVIMVQRGGTGSPECHNSA